MINCDYGIILGSDSADRTWEGRRELTLQEFCAIEWRVGDMRAVIDELAT